MDLSKPFYPCQLRALRLVRVTTSSDLETNFIERISCPMYDLHAERWTPEHIVASNLLCNDPVYHYRLEVELVDALCKNCPEVNNEQYRCEENEDDGCPC